MKTKAFSILLAVLTLASMIPVASAQRANGNLAPQRIDKGASTQVAESATRALPKTCVSQACCITKSQVQTAEGRSTRITSTKVKACNTACQIASNDQRAACGKGKRA
ncbi:hypothetical protein JIN84_17350 [Luteolibacter yonseiensis]|uniref:Uncharacterized protein n=1 Tax=Luteolibacter yonseiensis TaxID=1144680 RepID=A0A934R8Y2_9BACT|nr:hypothetical protein [Luteolibacter yonseiensis]MBK1817390.1 hypothetical protein [Luteolibacter yonseiensis]